MWTYNQSPRTDELYHHGVLGQKWGVRRYQNADGSLTAQGKKRYGSKEVSVKSSSSKKTTKSEHKGLSDGQKKAIKIGAAATAVALATVGTVYLAKTGRLNVLAKIGKQATHNALNSIKKSKISSIPKSVLSKAKTVLSKTTRGKLHNISEVDLDNLIKRLGNEKKAFDLISEVEHPVKSRMKKVAIKTGETAATGAALYLTGSLIDKEIDKKQLAKYVRQGGVKKK